MSKLILRKFKSKNLNIWILLLFFLLATFVATALPNSSISPWTPELALQVKNISSVVVSPDGSQTVIAVKTADLKNNKFITKFYLVQNASKVIRQLVSKLQSLSLPQWSPRGKWIAFLAKDKKYQSLWKFNLAKGKLQKIVEMPNNIEDFKWSPDGKSVAFLMAQPETSAEIKTKQEKLDYKVIGQDFKMVQLYIVSVQKQKQNQNNTQHIKPLTPASYTINSFNWAPDGKTIAVTHQPTPQVDDFNKSRLSLLNIDNKSITPILPQIDAIEPHFSPDGKWIAFKTLTSKTPQQPDIRYAEISTYLCLVKPNGKEFHYLAKTFNEKNFIIGWTADSKNLIAQGYYKTTSRLLILSANGDTYTYLTLENLLIDNLATLNNNHTYLGFTFESPTKPAEAFISQIKPFKPRQITHIQKLPKMPIKKIDIIHWTSVDGKPIEGLLVYPQNYEQGKLLPLIVAVHGGPANSWKIEYMGKPEANLPFSFAVLASQGYAIFAPNIRGSQGYGRDFAQSNYRNWGGNDYQDIMRGIDYLVKQGIADPDRLGLWGWSYGGYMSAWAITQTNRFKAAIEGAGLTDLISFTGTADVHNLLPSYLGGDFWNNKNLWLKLSPIMHVENVSTPVLIQYSGADKRVPATQGLEFYYALKKRKVPVKMIIYPRQEHHFVEPKMLIAGMQHMINWFNHYLN